MKGLRHYFIKPYTALKIEKYAFIFHVPLNLAIQHFILEIHEVFFFKLYLISLKNINPIV